MSGVIFDPLLGQLRTSDSSGTSSPLTTKGDIYTFSTVNARLGVGTDGWALVADSTQTTGLKWASVGGTGNMNTSTYDPAGIAQQLVGTTATQTLTGKTITSGKYDKISDTNGNNSILITATASAVNGINIINRSTGGFPIITPGGSGSDTNQSLVISGHGTGGVNIATTDGTGFIGTFSPALGTTNGFAMGSNTTGAAPFIGVQGSDTNINLNLKTVGTGIVQANGVAIVDISSSQTLTNKDLTSGTNTFPTFNQNTTGSAATLTTARTIGIATGDVTSAGSTFNGSANNTNAYTLATVNANVGSFGSATQAGTFTVNAKGLTTAASNVTITPAVGSITGLGTGVATFLATPSSANLASAITDETGSGALVFGTTPTISTPVLNGTSTGTGVATASTASTLALRDSNGNLSAANHIEGYTTTATAAGTTTFTVASNYEQFFTGSTTQTVILPVVSTLVLGQSFSITNNSTGVVTVQSSGANTILALGTNSTVIFTCILTTGTTAASWSANQVLGSNSFVTSETPTGSVNGSNTSFTVLKSSYVSGTLEVWVNGMEQQRTTHYTETTPGSGVFTFGTAPLTGDNVMVGYQYATSTTGNAQSVNGFGASSTATANQLIALDGSALLPLAALPVGTELQTVSALTTSFATGTTLTPNDNTIPQNTEGDQYMSVTITPKSTTNTLVITSTIVASSSAANIVFTSALYQDSVANALAAVPFFTNGATFVPNTWSFTHTMAAGTTSATTFKVRLGGQSAGTTTFNGVNGAGLYGAITKSSMVITEYKA